MAGIVRLPGMLTLRRIDRRALGDPALPLVDLAEMKMMASIPMGKSRHGVFILRPSDLGSR